MQIRLFFFTFVALVLALTARAQWSEERYIDLQADNAVAAKEQGLQRAEQEALQKLLLTLAPSLAKADLGSLEDPCSACVSSVEVYDEKFSGIRYRARVIVNFDAPCIQNILTAKGVSVTPPTAKEDNASSRTLVLAIYTPDQTTQFNPWADDAEWQQAVENVMVEKNQTDLFPLRDLTDQTLLPTLSLTQLSFNQVERIAHQYEADQVYLLVASPVTHEAGKSLKITTHRLTAFKHITCNTIEVARGEVSDDTSWYKNAAQQAVENIMHCTPSAPIIPATSQANPSSPTFASEKDSTPSSIQGDVTFTSLNEWIRVSKALSQLGSVASTQIKQLEATKGMLIIHLRGSLETFLTEVRALGLKTVQISEQIVEIKVENLTE